ncbi:pyridoxal phosphate-dependent aminotransferase [Candidatus Roizmanbacteria bacterium]|nr:pyridoxal phosphate-dependent aminotransferase [Candidatus Roizmanbacteria bacterium]
MLSKRILKLQPSPTFAIDAKVKQMQLEGIPVINLTLGEPDFPTPKYIQEAGVCAIRDGFTHYTATAGILDLRKAIVAKLAQENGVNYTPQEIAVGVGAKQLLYHVFQVLCETGDEVIVPTPTWSTYIEQIILTGAKPILIPLKFPFKITALNIKKHITNKTKVILLNSPSNPTGSLIEKNELKKIAQIAVEKGIYVISDEIYEKIIYEKKHYSIASFGEKIKQLTIIINGFSKTYAMTGWRIGYAAGPQKIIQAMINLQGQTTSNTSSISQKAAVVALSGDQLPIKKMIKEFKKRRDFLCRALTQMTDLSWEKPEGTFYLFVNIQKLLNKKYPTSEKWAEALLSVASVAVIPGEAFYAPGYIRICFTTSIKNLSEGVKNINTFIKNKNQST